MEQSRAEEQFTEIVEALSKTRGVTHSKPGSRLFGSSTLKVHDKIFAMVSANGEFVVKLPKGRVEALVATSAGNRFDAIAGAL